MILFVFLFIFSLYCVYYGSLHSIVFLLFIEILVLLVLSLFFFLSFSWFTGLMFILVAVCVGAYGVCLLVSLRRSKGGVYIFSF